MKTGLRRTRHLAALAGVLLAGALAVPAAASPEQPAQPAHRGGCIRAFDEIQRLDMESFRDFDAETFRSVHVEDAVTIFASGRIEYGIDAIMEALAPHFANRNAVWEWTELFRSIDRGCKTG
ncbi:MAG: hypothetical protein ACRD29_05805 [Acidimicrobiales bacterium]